MKNRVGDASGSTPRQNLSEALRLEHLSTPVIAAAGAEAETMMMSTCPSLSFQISSAVGLPVNAGVGGIRERWRMMRSPGIFAASSRLVDFAPFIPFGPSVTRRAPRILSRLRHSMLIVSGPIVRDELIGPSRRGTKASALTVLPPRRSSGPSSV